MDTLMNVGAMFAVMLGTLLIVALAYWAFDRWAFPKLEFSDELKKDNRAVAIFLAAIVLGMFLLASRATAGPLDRYDDSFREHARLKFGYAVAWEFFKAQGMTESNLDPGACSHVGACGLMQFMPGTAVAMGLQDRFDAKASIRAGIAYDKAMWNQFTVPRPALDRLAFAFMSYNAGLGNVLAFQRRAEAARADPNLFKTIRPWVWREPGEYVERIARWQGRYTRQPPWVTAWTG